MIVDEGGRVSGSIDVAQLAVLYEQADDEDLRDHYRQVAAENGLTLGEQQAVPAEEAVPKEAEPEGETKPEFYGAWSLAELQDEAAARGLAKSGNKADLAERLAADDAAPEPEEE
ncbi:MAG TPA: SAP domain-containing protein [Candidatus Limnocylindrales bacterium]